MEAFNNIWGGGKNILTLREESGPSLMATVLDSRTKIFYGIEGYEHERQWILGRLRKLLWPSRPASKPLRTGLVVSPMAHKGNPSSALLPLSSQDATVERAVEDVEAFKKIPPLPMVNNGHNGQEIFQDPLWWWVPWPLCLPRYPGVYWAFLCRRSSRNDCSRTLARP